MANIVNYDHPITTLGSEYKKDRLFLLDDEVAKSLNTYKNWGEFGAPSEPILDSATDSMKNTSNISIKSLFNNVNSVGNNQFMQVRNNAPLLDNPEMRMMQRQTADCSIKALVEASRNNQLGRAVYDYSDFMYCKHLGKLSNNYMVTLRRFAFPCGDHINYVDTFDSVHEENKDNEQHSPDVGRLITWIGTPGNDMSNILKYSVKMPFKSMESKIEEGGDAGGDSGGPLGTFLNVTTNKGYHNAMIKGYAGSSTFSYMQNLSKPLGKIPLIGGTLSSLGQEQPPYSDHLGHQDQSKVYGPVDSIASTHIRDVGLEFTQDISLTFDYELRSYDGINGKAAMLDLIGNILAVTYQTGSFWGGAYRCRGASQSNIFANLPIYKLDGNSSFSDVVDATLDSGKQILKGMNGGKGFTGNILQDAMNIFKNIGSGLFSALLGAGLNKLGRPQKNAVNSLLSPAPVGFWHLTIGNPWHPIMMMGNMILDGCDIEHYGPLGLDDFPTGLRVTVKLKHAKPRDASLIEMMYLMGESRVYTPVGKEVLKMYEASTPTKSESVVSKERIKEKLTQVASNTSIDKDELDYVPAKTMTNIIGTRDPALLAIVGDMPDPMEIPKDQTLIGTTKENLKRTTDKMIKDEKENCKKLFRQFFGTTDVEMIIHTAREAEFGDKKRKKKDNEKDNKGK